MYATQVVQTTPSFLKAVSLKQLVLWEQWAKWCTFRGQERGWRVSDCPGPAHSSTRGYVILMTSNIRRGSWSPKQCMYFVIIEGEDMWLLVGPNQRKMSRDCDFQIKEFDILLFLLLPQLPWTRVRCLRRVALCIPTPTKDCAVSKTLTCVVFCQCHVEFCCVSYP